MEAQRVISVSLGKMAQSRVQRSGCSLHKSLMVASILQKARHVYVEQTFMMHCRPPMPPAVAPCPPPPPPVPAPVVEEDEPTYTDLDACSPAARGGGPADSLGAAARRKRLISDEETEEAVASILPKRARTDFVELEACPRVKPQLVECVSSSHVADEVSELGARVAELSPSKDSSKDGGDSDDSDDSCYESGDSDDSEADTMEIDRITSLVSVFSLDKLQRGGAAAVPVLA